jgi:dienelactone hydrolase
MTWRIVLALLVSTAAAHAANVTIPGPQGTALQASLFEPSVKNAAPGIVLLHGCAGPMPEREEQWVDLFIKAGDVVLLPDSFASRGLGSQCTVPEHLRTVTATGVRRLDGLAAAKWLDARPGTPPGGVVVMGWSNGGETTLAVGASQPDTPKGLIRGLVAFYPGCIGVSQTPGWKPVAPLLLLNGEADDWTPVAPCRALARSLGSMMELVTYPGAYHDFEAPHYPVRTQRASIGTVHVGTDTAGRADSLQRVPAFIAKLPPIN